MVIMMVPTKVPKGKEVVHVTERGAKHLMLFGGTTAHIPGTVGRV